ncbi:immunoglobulin lambda-1 light chain-like [Rhinoraja longicauda]
MSPLVNPFILVLLHSLLAEGKYQSLAVSQTPPSIFALRGQSAKINCSYSHDNYEQVWIKWERKHSAQRLCDYTFNRFKPKYTQRDCTRRAGITLDPTTNSFILTISNLQVNDSGIYLCRMSLEIPPPVQMVMGNSTNLTVEARPWVGVRVEPLSTPTQGVRLTCTSLDFYPGPIQVSWFTDGHELTNGTETGPLSPNPDGSFSISSFLNLSLTAWGQGGNYTCQVNHSTLHKPIRQHISARSTGKENITRAIGRVTVLAVAMLIVMASLVLYFKPRKAGNKAGVLRENSQRHDALRLEAVSRNNYTSLK